MSEQAGQRLVIHSNAGRDRGRPIPPVSQGQYLKDIGAKIGLFALALFVLLAGLGFLAASCWFGCRYSASEPVFEIAVYVSLGVLCFGRHFFVEAVQIKPVRPVIAQNAHRFSPGEILLRPSDAPSSHQQAELLRGVATPGAAPPPEELLRASATRGPS